MTTAPDEPTTVETHVSVLVFLDDLVLKYKKPVQLAFVDLRGRQARHRACVAEVAVNRRLAPDVYLGVADVVLGDGAVDHAVAMRRLDRSQTLAAMVARGDPGLAAAVDAVADGLARFHARADRSPEIASLGLAPAVAARWEELVEQLAPFVGSVLAAPAVDEVARLAGRFLAGRGELLSERAAGGWVCDGHGDLLATDVFVLPDGPRLLDAVEFDDRLRWTDVAADVAFLAMDLEHRGAPAAAARLVTAYEAASGCPLPAALVHHYVAQRASVRALVACIGSAQGVPAAATEARRRLNLALEHLRAGRVVLGVVAGPPGVGKSTVAGEVGRALGWPVLSSDDVRHELFGRGTSGGRPAPGLDAGPHRPEATTATYTTLLERAGAQLRHGQSVILDATFGDRRHQQQVEALAEATASDLVVATGTLPAAAAAERVRRRGATASADEALAATLSARADPWPGAVAVSTDRPPERVAARVRSLLAHPPRPPAPPVRKRSAPPPR